MMDETEKTTETPYPPSNLKQQQYATSVGLLSTIKA